MAKESKESLAGRFFEFLVEPLDLEEYLEFTGTEIDRRREKVYELEIKRSLRHHALTGGFIEALALDDIQRKKYFRESLLERVIYRDIPEHFTVKSMDLPYLLMSVFCDRPGMLVDYRSLGNDLEHDQRTVAGYVSYLEYSLLAHKLYNFSPNRLTSEKKARKIYPSSTAFTAALSGVSDFAALAEQYFAINLKARFFWRSPQKEEVDLVLTPDDRIIPVEIKMRETIKERDARPLFKFMARYGISRCLVISLDMEGRFDDGVRAVDVIPYWRHWTIRRRFEI
ncbi:MAG: ATP-binding protein [Actinobacteria bacterium]|nr:ATP-binding protein [Actinomycetota bacterium]